ncbi:MAG: type II toxin-antitoxin system prevent-host-death family antitoxin [Sulfuricellaceae bacterium]|nr:type II toxin-antitoxin system prevent-host-death family antitoxin [Sulfuricellaceae bacterium]
MSQFNIAEAKSHFSELVKKAMLGEEVVIAKGNKPVLKLVLVAEAARERMPGSAKGKITYLAPDFGNIPEDFQDYV